MTATPSPAMVQRIKKSVEKVVRSQPRELTMLEFDRRFANKKDGFKYEFVRGRVIKTEKNMNPNQYYIVANLMRAFTKTAAYANGDELAIELSQLTGKEQKRIPDLCYYPKSKLMTMAWPISGFVIEINSPTDRNDDIIEKREEYFAAGVEVIWQIDQKNESVSVFSGPTSVKICKGNDEISAAPVVSDFEMTVEQVFKRG